MDKYLDKDFLKAIKPKLVRDNVPDIIVSQNKRCTFRKLFNQEEINIARKTKVLEELEELKEAIISEDNDSIREEISDFIEIFYFWLNGKFDWGCLDDLNDDIEEKVEENGSFEKNYFIEKVELYEEEENA